MRALGVDFGRARIGLAAGDMESRLPAPLSTLKASGKLRTDAEALVQIAKIERAEIIVLGLPLHHDERAATIVQRLGAEIEALGFRVSYTDESMTTVEAHDTMRDAGLTAAQRRTRVDAEAACRILDRFFEEQGG